MLTREELLVAAGRAEQYPPGWGASLFAGDVVQDPGEALEALEAGRVHLEDG